MLPLLVLSSTLGVPFLCFFSFCREKKEDNEKDTLFQTMGGKSDDNDGLTLIRIVTLFLLIRIHDLFYFMYVLNCISATMFCLFPFCRKKKDDNEKDKAIEYGNRKVQCF